ncbi:MAG: L,D-transpeptidase [Chitinophagaceae bacterium]|jgi:murein L,D-transpeptidase YafK|uniref:L,D-transpeptidase family protein n=1 Tax=unclassified Paraflavitalea TaxID=2798305 RepID=UPI003D34A8AF|nr:L,D-transpeptidase [Chitinophagaceae bacterium]
MQTKFLTGLLLLSSLLLVSFKHTSVRSTKHSKFNNQPNGTVYLIIDKTDYELSVYDDDGWFATYPVVFGNKVLTDKLMEGDKKTPEGSFKILSKRVHDKWHRMFLLDFPNKESWDKFKQRKAAGIIPANAKIGNGIAIHGTWPNDDIVVDTYTNWTNGCISLRNDDIDELNEILKVGSKVIIRY